MVVTREAGAHTADWRARVSTIAGEAHRGRVLEGGLSLAVSFRFLRPKSHYRTGANADSRRPWHLLRASAPGYHTQRPDATKLLRALEDALTGILWRDDAQVVRQACSKEWVADQPGAMVVVAGVE